MIYRRVSVGMWGDEKFRRLSPLKPSGQALWIYLLTGPHTGPIPGLFSVTQSELQERLGWEPKAFREAFREVLGLGLIEFSESDKIVWIFRAINHNRPQSPNVIRSWGKAADLIPDGDLKNRALAHLYDHLKDFGKGFRKAFRDTFPKGVAITGAVTGTGKGEARGHARAREVAPATPPKSGSRDQRQTTPSNGRSAELLRRHAEAFHLGGDELQRRYIQATQALEDDGQDPLDLHPRDLLTPTDQPPPMEEL